MNRREKRIAHLRMITEAIHIMATLSGIVDDFDFDSGEPILKINPLIHKVVIAGDRSNCEGYGQSIKKLFHPLYLDEKYKPEVRRPHYGERRIKNLRDCKIIIFTKPQGYRPPYLMEIYSKENTTIRALKDRLIEVCFHLPHSLMTEVEYTLDIPCHNSSSVQNLFNVLSKHIYVPYQRDPYLCGGGQQMLGKSMRMNAIYKLSRAVKLYERGFDNKKQMDGWNIGDVNRVRFEHTASYPTLRKHCIRLLRDFIQDARFSKVNRDMYKFKRFVYSKRLPQPSETYTTPNKYGNHGCFQIEVKEYRFML